MKRVWRIPFVLILLLVLILGAIYLIVVVPAATTCSAGGSFEKDGAWTTGTAMLTKRSELAATTLNDKFYVGGGLGLTGATKAFESFDVAGESWEKLAPLPSALHHFGMASAADQIFISGGYKGNNFSTSTNEVWAYEPASDAWSPVTPMPGNRAAHTMVSMNGKLYVLGGVGIGSTFIWIYDPEIDSWDTLAPMLPTPREHLAGVALDGKLYAIGGRWAGQGNLSTLEIYDPLIDRWERGPDMPTARGGLTAGVVDGRIHVTGGEDFDASPSCTFAQHEVYDPETETWLTLLPLPTPRHGLASGVIDSRWYVIGGATKASTLTLVSTSDRVEIFAP